MDRRVLPRLSALPPLGPPPPPTLSLPPLPKAASGSAGNQAGNQADDQADDKVLRRRLQYKYHQRRHRAKQKEKTLTLERDVRALSADVDALLRRREALSAGVDDVRGLVDGMAMHGMVTSSHLLCSARGASGGAPARTVVEFFRQYESGWSAAREPEQQAFLRSVMTAQTRGPDYTGVEFVLDQFRRFGAVFAVMRFDTRAPQVTTAGDLTVVTMDAVLRMRPHRAGLMAICPGVQNHEDAVQMLVGAQLVVPSRYTFVFDARGKVDFFGADMNFLGALQDALGSLHATAELFTDAQISSSTGQIYAVPAPAFARPAEPSDPRLQVDFLLS
jgi:hypothetical protein